MQKVWDLAIIGGGASGMAAAISAAESGDKVLLLEKSPSLGRKIAASGNGRCNLMNTGTPVYYGDTCFAHDVLQQFSVNDLKQYWMSLGIILTQDDAHRVYPCTYHSGTVLDALKTALRRNKVDVILQATVTDAKLTGAFFQIETPEKTFHSRRILIAAGGPASPKLGGSDSGYSILESFGHHIIPPKPALCPLITDSKSISGLSGIRARCSVTLYNKYHLPLCSREGEVLFTDYGISGICAMQCARFFEKETCVLELDFTTSLFSSDELSELLHRRREQFSEFSPEYLLNGILVPRLSYAVLKQAGIPLKNNTAGALSDDELKAVEEHLHHYSLQVSGVKGFDNAQVTAGGAECGEFSAANLESLLVPGLHATGEVLNVDGDCGGFNLMFAFASGILAGRNSRRGKE